MVVNTFTTNANPRFTHKQNQFKDIYPYLFSSGSIVLVVTFTKFGISEDKEFMNEHYFIERWWKKICDIPFVSILFQFAKWNDFHCWHISVLCVTMHEHDLSPNELINSDQKTPTISNMYFWLRFLSCGCYFPILPLATEYTVCDLDSEENGMRKRKRKLEIRKTIYWELSYLVDSRRPVDENKNPHSIHWIFFIQSLLLSFFLFRIQQMNSDCVTDTNPDVHHWSEF